METPREFEIPKGKKMIAFEGIDGCGKTTLSRMVAEKLRAHWTCQPSHGPIGKMIREELGRLEAAELMQPLKRAELAALFAADRLQIWRDLLALFESGRSLIVSDRWWHSSLVYQAKLHHEWGAIVTMNHEVPQPTLTFLIDVPAELAHQRALERGHREPFKLDALKAFAKTYASLPRSFVTMGVNAGPQSYVVLDGKRPLIELADYCCQRIASCHA